MKKILQLSTLLAIVAFAPTAHADVRPGAMRYHLDVSLLSFASTSVSVDGNDAGGSTQLSLGLAPLELGLGLGYVASDLILVGTTVVLNHQIISVDDSDADAATRTVVGLRPYLEFLLGAGSTVPFVGVFAGVSHAAANMGNGSATGVTVGAMGGAHMLVSSGGSIDVSGQLAYTTVSEDTLDVSVVSMTAVLSVSAWGL